MQTRVDLWLSPRRHYVAYLDDGAVHIEATIDGNAAAMGRACWDGRALSALTTPLRADVLAALTAALRARAASP